MDIIPYNRHHRDRARQLRKGHNLAEVILWKQLSRKRLGYQFLRQRSIGFYIADFYSKELRLAIEVDGGIHKEKVEQDVFRQGEFEAYGITMIRFSDRIF